MQKHFIGGRWLDSVSGQTLPVLDPSTGEAFDTLARGDARDVDRAVAAAREALAGPWGRMSATERGRILMRMAALTLERAETLARLEARDTGKPMAQARNDIQVAARYLEYYGSAADKLHGEVVPYMEDFHVVVLHEPYGVTGHILPWNYPAQMFGRSIAPALATGNASVLKPSEDACLTPLAFCDIALEAGLPAGALNVVTGLGEEAGAALSSHRGVAHLSFTGSVAVGQLIQTAAAQNTIPVTLELGGKSPQIVFADADLDAALPFLVNAGIQNCGQTCSAASRILVERPVFDEVRRRMAERYAALRVGPAMDDLDVGPVISARQREIVQGFLAIARDTGLQVAAQARLPASLPAGGCYVPPTLLAPAAADHRLAQEEIFGPVQVMIPFDGEAEALAIANGTNYGLVAGVWTRDGGRQLRMARKLHCGQVFINNYGAGGGIELPFGGVKHSGHGREKGFEALYGFSSLKTVAIKHD
jgi:aldehyde dehydrogenase (NAD+)